MNVYVVVKRHVKEGEEYTDVLSVNITMRETLESIHQETLRNKAEYSVIEIENELDHNNVFFTHNTEYTIHKAQLDL